MRHQRMATPGLVPHQADDVHDPRRSLPHIISSRKSAFRWPDPTEGEPPEPGAFDELLKIRDHERQRLAQELHDSAGQLLVALELSIARLKLVEKDCAHGAIIDEIQYNVGQIDREIRSLAFLHYPVELGERCLCSALQALVLGFGRRSGMHTSFEFVGDRASVGESISAAILRIAQEALVNIHRHSRATAVKVAVKRRADVLHVAISDNGVGFPSSVTLQNAQGIGLQGMRHRVDMLGGRFRIRNLKRGAKLTAVVPVPRAGSAGF